MNEQEAQDMQWLVREIESMYRWNGWHGNTDEEKRSRKRKVEAIKKRLDNSRWSDKLMRNIWG